MTATTSVTYNTDSATKSGKTSGFSWYWGVIIGVLIMMPVFGIILYMLRKNKVNDENAEKKKMRISAAVEDVDWGLENDPKES